MCLHVCVFCIHFPGVHGNLVGNISALDPTRVLGLFYLKNMMYAFKVLQQMCDDQCKMCSLTPSGDGFYGVFF
jgi:hypothetical protein